MNREWILVSHESIGDARISHIAPIPTNLILAYIGEHVPGMPRCY